MKTQDKKETCLMCPFADDTEVTPFFGGETARCWTAANCEQCLDYENESKNEKEAKCKMAFYLDFGYISSSIPLWAAKRIGVKEYDPLTGHIALRDKCNCYIDEDSKNMPF